MLKFLHRYRVVLGAWFAWNTVVIGSDARCAGVLSYGGVEFEVTAIGSKGYAIHPQRHDVPQEVLEQPVIRELNTIWDSKAHQNTRHPVVIGTADPDGFTQPGVVRSLDMPIRFPGTDYRVPAEYAHLKSTLQKIVDFEHSINPQVDDYYAYLTVDQVVVKKGASQRVPGPHVDGLQGARYSPKTRIDHSYLVTSSDPTVFFTHAFHMGHLDVAVDNFNTAFKEQADPTQVFRPEPYEIALMNAYSVHESPVVTQEGLRTLVRVEYSLKKFDRLGNTHNPLFDYHWEMVPRPVPDDLQ